MVTGYVPTNAMDQEVSYNCWAMMTVASASQRSPSMDNQSAQPRARRKHRSLAQELVAELSQQIRDGMLKRGDKLPTESAIMQTRSEEHTSELQSLMRLSYAVLC